MFSSEQPAPSKKRLREEDDEPSATGFSEHRWAKRQIPSLAFRQSPEAKRRTLPNLTTAEVPPLSPSVADITPASSDSEELPTINEPKSFFSPWSSSPTFSNIPSSQHSPCPGSSQSMMDAPIYSDDIDMADSNHLYPGPFQADPTASLSCRIPTPIVSHFSSNIRPIDRTPLLPSYSGVNNMQPPSEPSDRGRRLPSPISEDEISPSLILNGLGEIQMQETHDEPKAPAKKGHTRSKHSFKSWGSGPDSEMVGGKRFVMGFRSDCEKCQKKVPGHFSHIITY